MNYIRFDLGLRPDQYSKLEDVKHKMKKKDRAVSLAKLIREAIDEYLKEGKNAR